MTDYTEHYQPEETFATDWINIRVSFPSGQEVDTAMHFHTKSNIVFFLAGGCIEKRLQASFERSASDAIFLHAGEWHQTTLTMPSSRYISLEIDQIMLDQCRINEAAVCQTVNETPDGRFLMLKIYHEILQNDKFSPDSIQMLVYQFAEFSRSLTQTNKAPEWIKTVHQLLNDRWNETVSRADLAKATGLHPTSISKYFPLYFASSLGEYIRKLRIARSLDIIKKNRSSLTNTAYTCNFADQSHFIRNFRHYTSFTPKQFQKL